MSSTTSQWSLEPLLHGHLPTDALLEVGSDIGIIRFCLAAILALSLLFPFTHQLLLKVCKEYRAMKTSKKQIVVVHHALEAVILSVVLPFFTYYMLKVNFKEMDLSEFTSSVRGIIKCAFCVLMLYPFELVSRFEEPRPLVIFHHVLSFSDFLLSIILMSSVTVKAAMILGFLICFEAPIFMGLFMYRMFPKSRYTSKVMFLGMLSFGLTRPIQVIWIGAAVFGSWNHENVVKWEGLLQIVITLVLTAIQLFTLKIHYGIWQRCISMRKGSDAMMQDSKAPRSKSTQDCAVDIEKGDGSERSDEEIRDRTSNMSEHSEEISSNVSD